MMDTRDKVTLDFHLKAYEQAASAINNLQTALFTTFTIIIASGIVGILVGFRDLSSALTDVCRFPGILIVTVSLWGIALFLTAVATYIFIACIVYGYKIINIEKDFLKKPILHGEAENFLHNDEARFWHIISTYTYFPGLLASGYCHKYFLPLFILTVSLTTIVSIVQYLLLKCAVSPDVTSIYYGIYLLLSFNPFWFSVFAWLLFLVICLVIVPIITPNSRQVGRDLQDKEVLVVSDTLSHLHGTEVSIIGFAAHALQMGKSTLVVGPIEKGGQIIREKCEDSKIPVPVVQLPSIKASFLGQSDFRLANPFPLRFLVSNTTQYIFIGAFPGPLGLLALLLGKRREKKVIFCYNVYLPKFAECIPLIGRTKFIKTFFKYITRSFSNLCDLVIAPSKAVFNEMIEWGVKEC